jgi:hypothetical protein
MKWQDLIRGLCPRCGSRLRAVKENVVIYECTDPEGVCTFMLTERRYREMLADPESPVHRYATPEDKAHLEELKQRS